MRSARQQPLGPPQRRRPPRGGAGAGRGRRPPLPPTGATTPGRLPARFGRFAEYPGQQAQRPPPPRGGAGAGRGSRPPLPPTGATTPGRLPARFGSFPCRRWQDRRGGTARRSYGTLRGGDSNSDAVPFTASASPCAFSAALMWPISPGRSSRGNRARLDPSGSDDRRFRKAEFLIGSVERHVVPRVEPRKDILQPEGRKIVAQGVSRGNEG